MLQRAEALILGGKKKQSKQIYLIFFRTRFLRIGPVCGGCFLKFPVAVLSCGSLSCLLVCESVCVLGEKHNDTIALGP